MRRLESRPYRVIIPVHVARLLAQVERRTAAALQEELNALAEKYGRTPPSFAGPKMLSLTIDGTTIEYECDPQNEALIAMDLIGNL